MSDHVRIAYLFFLHVVLRSEWPRTSDAKVSWLVKYVFHPLNLNLDTTLCLSVSFETQNVLFQGPTKPIVFPRPKLWYDTANVNNSIGNVLE